ncbi:unnamed protein product [Rotaria sp. Silwood1]|nr:unnamed protein product [Rotaria sp. Silwood1]CAF3927865.1 unnamed protein product [Rotaria sp. Silwood1]CAF4989104.1 unnamed protein product [Rotaria sp. Silwood1]CAF5097257.1 unnamed protein product [Rotaria sp. Silwood1]
MLLWIDSPENDRMLIEEIKRNYASVKINFQLSYKEAQKFLNENADDIRQREIFVTICRAYYGSESKSFTDIVRLFQRLAIGRRPIAVYTMSTIALLQKTPNLPEEIKVFESPEDLFDFISGYLSK